MKIEPYHAGPEPRRPLNAPPRDPPRLPGDFVRWISQLLIRLKPVPEWYEGDGSPEGVLSAPKKARYFNNSGTAGTLLYVKTTASGNTGWVAYG